MGRASEGKVFLGKDSREPLSRIVWLTETKIRRRYFFYPRGGNVGGKGGGGGRMARLDSVRASTDKRQTPSPPSSFVCFKRHLFGGGGGGSSAVPPRTVSRREGASEGPSRWKGCGRYGVAWLERPHLNATGKGPSALSSLRLCRATYATRPHTSRP